MEFDFQSAIAAANAAVERQENGGGSGYKYPLIYPQAGHTITVKPLFNPASGQIVRLINRHEKVPCYKTYGIDCPICSIQQQVKDMTGQDPFGRTKASKSRGICFAQYISSTNQIKKSQDAILQPGEIILFMFPWSVYTQINATIQAISQTPTGMDQAFCHAQTGMFLQINVSPDFKYTTTNVPYMTFPSQMTDEDFMKMLTEMESLNEQVLPSSITEEVDKQVKEYVDAIYRQYINPQVPNQAPAPVQPQPQQINSSMTPYRFIDNPNLSSSYPNNVGPQNNPNPSVSTYQNPDAVSSVPSSDPNIPTTSSNSGEMPPCFSQHQENNPQCICCPYEVVCMEKSGH